MPSTKSGINFIDSLKRVKKDNWNTGIDLTAINPPTNLLQLGMLVKSIRGRKGGYLYAKDPSDISIKEIMNAVEEDMDATSCNGSSTCHHGKKCNTHNLWHELNQVVDNYLSKITINKLVESNNSPYISLREIN